MQINLLNIANIFFLSELWRSALELRNSSWQKNTNSTSSYLLILELETAWCVCISRFSWSTFKITWVKSLRGESWKVWKSLLISMTTEPNQSADEDCVIQELQNNWVKGPWVGIVFSGNKWLQDCVVLLEKQINSWEYANINVILGGIQQ